jgi:hypothetical protein
MNEYKATTSARPRPHRHINIATYNVRTLNNNGLFLLARGCRKFNIALVAVQEHRKQSAKDVDQIKEQDDLFVYSSATKSLLLS